MTPDTTDETSIETTDASLTIRRTFDAPRERVWEAWTDPAQVDQWWGPDGFATETEVMDVRSGGIWEFEMVGPGGETFPNRVVYDEVEEPSRLAYGHGSPDDPEQFHVTVTFEGTDDGGTELTMVIRFPSSETFDEAAEFGAIEGAKQTVDKLAHHLSTREVA
jgi:uncharacterized protein YndB with AHSA1/START domain